MFGEIETLVRKIDYSSMKAEHSIKKVGNAGNAVRQSVLSNDGAGGVSRVPPTWKINKDTRKDRLMPFRMR